MSSRTQTGKRTHPGAIDLVVEQHAHRLMIAHMANNLPQPLAPSVHDKSLPHPIVETDGILVEAVVPEAVAVHVEDVARGPVRVHVPDHFVVAAHFEGRVVGEDVAVHGEEGGGLELVGGGEVHELGVVD